MMFRHTVADKALTVKLKGTMTNLPVQKQTQQNKKHTEH